MMIFLSCSASSFRFSQTSISLSFKSSVRWWSSALASGSHLFFLKKNEKNGKNGKKKKKKKKKNKKKIKIKIKIKIKN